MRASNAVPRAKFAATRVQLWRITAPITRAKRSAKTASPSTPFCTFTSSACGDAAASCAAASARVGAAHASEDRVALADGRSRDAATRAFQRAPVSGSSTSMPHAAICCGVFLTSRADAHGIARPRESRGEHQSDRAGAEDRDHGPGALE